MPIGRYTETRLNINIPDIQHIGVGNLFTRLGEAVFVLHSNTEGPLGQLEMHETQWTKLIEKRASLTTNKAQMSTRRLSKSHLNFDWRLWSRRQRCNMALNDAFACLPSDQDCQLELSLQQHT